MAVKGGNKLERPFDDRLLGTGADDVGRGTSPNSSASASTSIDFPAPVSPVENVEARLEWKGDVGDDARSRTRSSVNTYFRVRSLRSPQCSFFRSRLKKLRRRAESGRWAGPPAELQAFARLIGVPTWPSKDTGLRRSRRNR